MIYTHSLLEGSMTFIHSHAEALVKHRAVYAGAHRVAGIPLPDERSYVLNDGTLAGTVREGLYRRFGWGRRLAKCLAEHGPEVVHAHFGTSGPAAMRLARQLGVPLVVTFHGRDATMSEQQASKSLRGREMIRKKGRMIEEAGAFIAVSDYIRRRLLEQGYPERKVLLHRNGIDLDCFQPRSNGPREPIVLFIGRFVEKKGARYLIDAAERLHRAGVTFELVMIGNGPLEQELKAAAARSGIPCTFPGFLSSLEVRGWLEKASIVALPSVTAADGDSEGLPTTLLEGQAMEAAIVATRHSGIPEGVQEGVTAELVEEKDVAALAEKIHGFLSDPARARAFGQAGRRFVARHFDLHTQVAGLEALYTDLYARYASRPQGAARW